MNKRKSFVAAFLVFMIAISTVVTAAAQPPYSREDTQRTDAEARMDALAHLKELYGEDFLVTHYPALHQYIMIQDSFMRRSDGSVIYPDFYGGAYIDSNGQLITLIVESKLGEALAYDVFKERIDNGAYRFVQFSFAELRELMDALIPKIDERIANNCIYAKNISSWGAQATINRVIIFLNDYNDEMIAGVRRYVYDSPMIVFMQRDFFRFGGESSPFMTVIQIFLMVGLFVIVIALCSRIRGFIRR